MPISWLSPLDGRFLRNGAIPKRGPSLCSVSGAADERSDGGPDPIRDRLQRGEIEAVEHRSVPRQDGSTDDDRHASKAERPARRHC